MSGTVYCAYPILPFGIVACTFFCDNISRNSCIQDSLRLILDESHFSSYKWPYSLVQVKSNRKPAGNCPDLHRLPPTRALEGFFSLLKHEFSWTSINCFYGFLTRSDREGSLTAEWRAKTYKIDFDGVFNYFMTMKDYIVQTTRSAS